MKIAIIAEGSYPYISGGVSSWANQLINAVSEHEFIIVSIMASRKENLEYKYKLPKNVSKVITFYLDDYLDQNPNQLNHKVKANDKEKEELIKFLTFDSECDVNSIIKLMINKKKFGTTIQFLQSEFFWEMILEIYNKSYSDNGLNEFFWSLRSMYLNMINVIQSQVPQADLYHSVSTGYSGLISLIGKIKYNSPFILTEHGIYPREREEELLKAKWVKGIYKKMWIDFFYFISKSAYKNADVIISLFNRSRDIQLELGSKEEKTLVIPNGVKNGFYDIEPKEHKGHIIGAIVRIVPIKDIKTLIRSFKIVKNSLEDVKLMIIGPSSEDEDYYEECLDLVKRLDLGDSIEFTGRVNIKDYLPIIDVLVLTSLSEGQPLVMLEGMAASIPFVSTDVGSCKELTSGTSEDNLGRSGIVTKPVSPLETANAIIKILSSKDEARRMGLVGRKRVKKYYTHDMFIEKYKQIYKKFGD
ncbi:GT4 family glycosyltransferase PelF [Helicovermis profundi]|uniref:GT4 family glycosyltransferase PelF n=1 Tax=Helicovermis profundi TaxID=3065157 RepID=A0AAU9EPA0_9FIRM|nr:GT4 family glycosyltransferase PelF [Clostridia bacterium S502]